MASVSKRIYVGWGSSFSQPAFEPDGDHHLLQRLDCVHQCHLHHRLDRVTLREHWVSEVWEGQAGRKEGALGVSSFFCSHTHTRHRQACVREGVNSTVRRSGGGHSQLWPARRVVSSRAWSSSRLWRGS